MNILLVQFWQLLGVDIEHLILLRCLILTGRFEYQESVARIHCGLLGIVQCRKS